jgi:HAD superfamily hydrolase (TIGR01490 family)
LKIALFDFDGTLVSAQFGRGLLKYSAENGRKDAVRLYYASLVPDLLLSKVAPAAEERFKRQIIARLPWLIRGKDLDSVDAAFAWVAHEYLLPSVRPQVLARLEDHLAEGYQVVIVSGIFERCLELIAAELGADGWVGTKLAFRNDRCTGRLDSPVVKGTEKVQRVREFINAQGWGVDWAVSFAYGDSFSDQGMLELAGNPVAVHPEPALRTLAVERGWQILDL